jgi:hypothetical protein
MSLGYQSTGCLGIVTKTPCSKYYPVGSALNACQFFFLLFFAINTCRGEACRCILLFLCSSILLALLCYAVMLDRVPWSSNIPPNLLKPFRRICLGCGIPALAGKVLVCGPFGSNLFLNLSKSQSSIMSGLLWIF